MQGSQRMAAGPGEKNLALTGEGQDAVVLQQDEGFTCCPEREGSGVLAADFLSERRIGPGILEESHSLQEAEAQ